MRLTRRQRQVAELIARGLTNRQTADALFISERTVEGHVLQLLNALGLTSRTQVATWFVREQLTAAETGAGIAAAVRPSATLLVAELAGFPVLADGTEAWPQRRFAELLSIRAHRHHGRVAELAESPGRRLAIFERGADAVRCALDLHRAVAVAYWAPGARSNVSIAVHRVELDPSDGRPSPEGVAACEWLVGRAGEGQTLVSGAAEAGLEAPLPAPAQLRLAGSHPLGDGEPIAVYELLDPESDVARARPAPRGQLSNLPLPLTSFIDRELELAQLRELLDRSRLVTLTGPGGVGKTRLALHLADGLLDAFAGGAWLVDLAQVTDPRLVTQAVATAVQVHEVPGTPLVDTLTGHLAERAVLLVLDNCEHVVTASAEVVETLLRGCPRLTVLATSREPLAVPGERVWPVLPLTHPGGQPATGEVPLLSRYPAIRLFVDRASAIEPAFRLTADNVEAVARIAARLEGIPLAIELAAAWVRIVDVDELLERLENRFELLTRGARTAPTRHQTLEAAIDWSDRLLGKNERLLFHRLSIFAGSFRLPDLETVCGDEAGPATIELLSGLVDKSLVIAGEGRYQCLDTIRDYGRRQLRKKGEMEELQARHGRHWADMLTAREPGQTAAWLRRVSGSHADVRAALRWSIDADPQLALSMVECLQPFWLYAGYLTEAQEWARRVLAAIGDEPVARARALVVSALAAYSCGDVATGRTEAQEAAALAGAPGREPTLARARQIQCMLAIAADDPVLAETFCAEAVSLHQRLGDRDGECSALYAMGLVVGFQGDLSRARATLERSLEIRTELGSRDEGGPTLAFLGLMSLLTGQQDAARSSIEESALAARHLGDRRAAWTLHVASYLASREGDDRRVLSLAAAAHAMHRAAGTRPPAVWNRFLSTWLDPAREALGPEAASVAWRAGTACTFEQALDLALGRDASAG